MGVTQTQKDPTFSSQFPLVIIDQTPVESVVQSQLDLNSSTSIFDVADRIGRPFTGGFMLHSVKFKIMTFNGANDGCKCELWTIDTNTDLPLAVVATSSNVVHPDSTPGGMVSEFIFDQVAPGGKIAALVGRVTGGAGQYAIMKFAGATGGERYERHDSLPWEHHTQDGNWFEAIGLSVSAKVLGGVLDIENQPVTIPSLLMNFSCGSTPLTWGVYLDWNGQAIKTELNADFPELCKPLYHFDVDLTGINNVVDLRANMRMDAHTTLQTQDDLLLNLTTNQVVNWAVLDLASIAPRGATGVILGVYVSDTGVPADHPFASFKRNGDDSTKPGRVISVYFQGMTGVTNFGVAPLRMDNTAKIQYYVKPSYSLTLKVQLLGWTFGAVALPFSQNEVGP